METPAHDLRSALAAMSFEVLPGGYALVGWSGPPVDADLADLEAPAQLIREEDETSLLVGVERLDAVLARHPDARVERDLRWIRFAAPMGWEVVGFLAHVSGKLAAAGVPIGAVCGYSRDHLFVPGKSVERARQVLVQLFPERRAGDDISGAHAEP